MSAAPLSHLATPLPRGVLGASAARAQGWAAAGAVVLAALAAQVLHHAAALSREHDYRAT